MNNGFGIDLLVLIVAMSISMVLIPLLIRYAPQLGMMDEPDPRKVHLVPVPRVGGVGIVIGALVPLALWLPWNDLTLSYLLGSLVLLVFGVWDDVKELGHYVKFTGQFIAVLTVVYYGDLYVSHLPFMGLEPLGETTGKLFTVIALVGMINAINHSDGLDGLAGGESLLSLGGIAYLGYQADDGVVMLITMATVGGVFGFLRFNSHPARVFMGDGGSQFLGFTLGFLAVYLTQISNPVLSPALPALLLGLPIVDILTVFIQRAWGGLNWFKATRNHIHHRLLELGLHHYESVVVIYSIQALFVICAILLPYESDALLVGIYLGVSAILFGFLIVAERSGRKLRAEELESDLDRLVSGMDPSGVLMLANRKLIQFLMSAFLVVGSLFAVSIPYDVSVTAAGLFILLAARLVFGYRLWFVFLRLILFVAIAFVVYLLDVYPPEWMQKHSSIEYAFYGLMIIAISLAVRASSRSLFQVTPLDYLVLLMVIGMAALSEMGFVEMSIIGMTMQLIVLFYGVEVIIRYMKSRWNVFTLSTLASLGVMAGRGLV